MIRMKIYKFWFACGVVGGILLVGCTKSPATQNNSLMAQSSNGMQGLKPARMVKSVNVKALYLKSKEK